MEMLRGSVADADSVNHTVAETNPALIVNLAFVSGVGIAEELEVMARGTWNVLDAARSTDARVVLASSVRVYGPQHVHGHDTVLDEGTPCLPVVRYGHYKFLGEQLAADYRRKHGVVATALRIPMVYGPGVREGALGVCLPARAAATGEPTVLPYDPDAVMCLAHVADVAKALADLGDPSTAKPERHVYELGGHMVSYAEMVEQAGEVAERKASVTFEPDPRRREHDFAYRLSNRRLVAERALEHRTLADGFRSIIDHERQRAGA